MQLHLLVHAQSIALDLLRPKNSNQAVLGQILHLALGKKKGVETVRIKMRFFKSLIMP